MSQPPNIILISLASSHQLIRVPNTCDVNICSNRLHLSTACRQYGLKLDFCRQKTCLCAIVWPCLHDSSLFYI